MAVAGSFPRATPQEHPKTIVLLVVVPLAVGALFGAVYQQVVPAESFMSTATGVHISRMSLGGLSAALSALFGLLNP